MGSFAAAWMFSHKILQSNFPNEEGNEFLNGATLWRIVRLLHNQYIEIFCRKEQMLRLLYVKVLSKAISRPASPSQESRALS